MKLCNLHWEALIVALHEKGLTNLIPDNSEIARLRWQNLRQSGITKFNFDPCWFAAFAIIENASLLGGVNTSEGEACPVCDYADRTPWIEFAASDAYQEAVRLGLRVENGD